MEYTTLNNGVEMPMLGYGVYKTPRAITEHCVREALETGYRLIDTAQAYGNEDGVGAAVAGSGLDRSEVFITTKTRTSGYRSTRRSIDESLRALRTDYVDLLLVHWSMGDDASTYRALEEAYHQGRARAIGLSNFYGSAFAGIAGRADVVPAVSQVETHVFYQQRRARAQFDQYHTQIESWGPLAEGMHGIFTDPVLTGIGDAHGRSAAQVALRFLTQSGVVVIPKSTHRERMVENFESLDFDLTDAEVARVRSLDTGTTLSGWPGVPEQNYDVESG
ncbi:aldo/keto reductase [uncultured Propionibacterium sp.]|uniref:aldo/keto reductase n=1 Tax=uncultured Propionibacterium sp. TaxID=218066 RepID=UPI00292FE8E1|nr:aldo/keto reductase [uncultured Propionibacterium sp.]